MGKHSALVIDDEPDIRELLAIILGRMDVECISAATVTQGKTLLASQNFDICLTDMNLPDGDGLEIVAHIQKEHSNSSRCGDHSARQYGASNPGVEGGCIRFCQ